MSENTPSPPAKSQPHVLNLTDILVGLVYGDFVPGQLLRCPEGIEFEILNKNAVSVRLLDVRNTKPHQVIYRRVEESDYQPNAQKNLV